MITKEPVITLHQEKKAKKEPELRNGYSILICSLIRKIFFHHFQKVLLIIFAKMDNETIWK